MTIVAFCCAFVSVSGQETPELKRIYNLPSGDASTTLNQFAKASERHLIFMVAKVRGVQTHAVVGEFFPADALAQMLAGTELRVVTEPGGGPFVVTRRDPNSIGHLAEVGSRRHPNTNMKRIKPIVAFAAWLGLTIAPSTPAYAAENADHVGIIEGRVFNAATGLALANAKVSVVGQAREVKTDETGTYRIANVGAGTVEIAVQYLGLDPQTASVTVPSGGRVQREFELTRIGVGRKSDTGDVVRLETFKVVEDFEMSSQAIAMNEQRNAPNLKNVVALDSFGTSGTGNIGDFLLFIPGVSVATSGDEMENVSLRGIPPSNTGFLIDGAPVASGQNNSRAVVLREVPMANISRVEVTKVPTPDVSAGGLGGSVNLITASPFQSKKPKFSYQVFEQFHSHTGLTLGGGRQNQIPKTTAKYNEPSFDLNYSHPVNKSFAFNLGVNRTWRKNQDIPDETATWDLIKLSLVRSGWGRYTQLYKTFSEQAGATWKISDKDVLSVNFQHRNYWRPTSRSAFSVFYGAGATGDATYVQGTQAALGTVTQGTDWRQDRSETSQFTLRYRHTSPLWEFSAIGFSSKSNTAQDDIDIGTFQNVNAVLSNLVIRGDQIPAEGFSPRRYSATDAAGRPVNVFNGDLYAIPSGTSGQFSRDGEVQGARLDLTRKAASNQALSLKTGVAIDQETRDARAALKTWNFVPNGRSDEASRLAGNFDVFDEAFLAGAATVYGTPYREISNKKVYELYLKNPSWFVLDEPLAHQNLVNNSRRYVETISAAYLRADLRLLRDSLWIVGGVRYEKTDGKGSGPLVDVNAQYQRDAAGNFIRDASGQRVLITRDPLALRKLAFRERAARAENSYDGFYPSLNVTYNISESLVLRGGYARTIGRPNLNFITPGVTISDPSVTNPTITVNNPALKPWLADNFDLSLESYFLKDGFGSVGIFQKNLTDFFGSISSPVTPELLERYSVQDDGTFGGYQIVSMTNAGNAKLKGIEFGYHQSLTFLPHWARGIQLFINATKLQVSGSATADFSSFNPSSLSGGVNYLRGRLFLRATYSYQGETRRTAIAASVAGGIPPNTYNYQAKQSRVSVNAQYSLTKHLSLYGGISDIGGFDELVTAIAPGTPEYAKGRRLKQLGYYTTLGIKGEF